MFNCVEQCYQFSKATTQAFCQLPGQEITRIKTIPGAESTPLQALPGIILSLTDPEEIVDFGRCTSYLAEEKPHWWKRMSVLWEHEVKNELHEIVHAKFTQDESLQLYLMMTGTFRLAFSDPRDANKGILCHAAEAVAYRRTHGEWEGRDLLGDALEKARRKIRAENPGKYPETYAFWVWYKWGVKLQDEREGRVPVRYTGEDVEREIERWVAQEAGDEMRYPLSTRGGTSPAAVYTSP